MTIWMEWGIWGNIGVYRNLDNKIFYHEIALNNFAVLIFFKKILNILFISFEVRATEKKSHTYTHTQTQWERERERDSICWLIPQRTAQWELTQSGIKGTLQTGMLLPQAMQDLLCPNAGSHALPWIFLFGRQRLRDSKNPESPPSDWFPLQMPAVVRAGLGSALEARNSGQKSMWVARTQTAWTTQGLVCEGASFRIQIWD